MKIEKNVVFNEVGQKLTMNVQLTYDKLEVFEFPASCDRCPCGFSVHNDCGRNVPFKEEDYQKRPATCKLKQITLTDLIEPENLRHETVARITTIGEEFFTPEQVRKMSQLEVRKNYKKILESMKYWN